MSNAESSRCPIEVATPKKLQKSIIAELSLGYDKVFGRMVAVIVYI